MRESLVGFCHLVGIFALLDSAANVVGSVDDLGGQASGHGLFTTAAAVQSQPAQAEGLAAGGADLQGNLVGGAADTAGLNFEAGHDVFHGLLEHFERIVAGLLFDSLKSFVNDLLSDALLAIELSGAIIMGTGFQPKALVQLAKTICRVLAVFFGWQHRSKLVASLSFTGYNKGLEGRTPQDWLNRDAAEVDKYRADERCMFTFTLNAYYSMFTGILRLYDPAVLARMPKDLPLLFLAGDADPVGEQGKGVQRAIDSLKAAGAQNIQKKLYPGARHELLMELNRQEVMADIAHWLEAQLQP